MRSTRTDPSAAVCDASLVDDPRDELLELGGYRARVDLDAVMSALTVEQLRAAGSLKWSDTRPGALGAWVAEMDMPLAPPIVTALTDAVHRGLTGYLPSWVAADARAASASWQQRYGRRVDASQVHLVPNVVSALMITADHLVPPAAPIVMPTPSYMPFFDVPPLVGRPLVRVPMLVDGTGRYEFDLGALAAAITPDSLVVLINPHNPTGRVFTGDELRDLAAVVERAGAWVFADEIHAPLVHAGHHHVPYACVSVAAKRHTVTATSASKGWNLPGLTCAQVILDDEFAGRRWDDLPPLAEHGTSPLGAIAATAAYTDGAEHLAGVVDYVGRGRHAFAAALAATLPAATFLPPEGTYLGWIDLRRAGLDPAKIEQAAGVKAIDGARCGAPGFLRVNLATAHHVLEEIAERLGRAAGMQRAAAG